MYQLDLDEFAIDSIEFTVDHCSWPDLNNQTIADFNVPNET
jgi:hypothetical protein